MNSARPRIRCPEDVVRLEKAEEARLRELSKPTGHPMPTWMQDKALLPKRPPGRVT